MPAKGETIRRKSESKGGERRRQEHEVHLNLSTLFAALDFSAQKHRTQRRKDAEASPYVNHLIAVTRVLIDEGCVTDENLLVAAILHDTVEDTETTFEELETQFGKTVAKLVREVTDDKSLPKQVRKELQVMHAPQLSSHAKQLKIADKIANLRDILQSPPADWPIKRKRDYVDWAEKVVAGCRGINAGLESAFDELVARARSSLS